MSAKALVFTLLYLYLNPNTRARILSGELFRRIKDFMLCRRRASLSWNEELEEHREITDDDEVLLGADEESGFPSTDYREM